MRLIDIENIDYVRLEDSLHCLEHHKGDEVECVICAPTVEAIPKADYENRLKADMVAMLTELQMEIEEIDVSDVVPEYQDGAEETKEYIANMIEEKINSLKEK